MKHPVRLFSCLSVFAAPALFASPVRAQVTRAGDAYQFRVKYHKGMKIDYLMTITLTTAAGTQPAPAPGGKAQTIIMTNTIDGTVTDVQNKIATIKMISGPLTFNGKAQGQAQTVTLKLDDRGKPVGDSPFNAQNLPLSVPDKPLKVGSTYSTKQTTSIMQMPISVNAVYKFEGMKSAQGHRYAAFTLTLDGSGNFPSPQGGASIKFTIKGTGTMARSVEDGLFMKSVAEQIVTILQPGKPLKLKSKTLISRR